MKLKTIILSGDILLFKACNASFKLLKKRHGNFTLTPLFDGLRFTVKASQIIQGIESNKFQLQPYGTQIEFY